MILIICIILCYPLTHQHHHRHHHPNRNKDAANRNTTRWQWQQWEKWTNSWWKQQRRGSIRANIHYQAEQQMLWASRFTGNSHVSGLFRSMGAISWTRPLGIAAFGPRRWNVASPRAAIEIWSVRGWVCHMSKSPGILCHCCKWIVSLAIILF